MDEKEKKEENPTAIEKPEVKAQAVDPTVQALKVMQEQIEQANARKAEDEKRQADINAAIEATVKAAMQSAPAEKGGGFARMNLKTQRGDSQEKAFWYWARTGDKGAYKADVFLGEGDEEQGGAVVPASFYNKIVARKAEASIIRKAPATILTVSNKTVNIPIQKAGVVEAAPVATNESYNATAVAADQNQVEPIDNQAITLVKYTRIHRLSDELLSDQQANLEEFLSGFVGQAFGLHENSLAFTYNTATSATYGSTKGYDAAAAAVAAADVVGLYGSLLDAYIDGSCWVMAPATYAAILSIQDEPFSFQNTPAGQLGSRSLMGQPVYTTAAMQAIGATNKSILFGNFRAGFMVAESSPMTVRRLTEVYAPYGQVGFLFAQRIGTAVVNANAINHLLHATG
jgi:HK97 family phage major capsid protein